MEYRYSNYEVPIKNICYIFIFSLKNMKRIIQLSIPIIYFISFFGLSQTELSNEESSHLVYPLLDHAKSIPSQAIYLSSDKDIYETQENIWFNALILEDNPFVEKGNDKIFYLNLIDSNKAVILSEKYEIKEGLVNGHLYLSDTLSPGKYSLIGYSTSSLKEERYHYKTIKPIEIRKTILPKVFIDYEFDNSNSENYTVSLHAYKRKGGFLSNTKFKLIGNIENRKVTIAKGVTDNDGKAQLNFILENKFDTYDLRIRVNSKYTEVIPLNIKLKNDSLTIDFFPEGGHLLPNIIQKIGFKVQDSRGVPVAFNGLLVDGSKVLDTLKSDINGLGSFYLLPEPDKDYTIQSVNSNEIINYELPSLESSGTSIKVENLLDGNLTFQILSSSSVNNPKKIYVRIQSKGVIHKMFKGLLTEKEKTVSVPLGNVTSGIMEISIYDEEYNCIATRLVYVKPEQRLYIEEQSKINFEYKTRSKVVITLKIIDQFKKPQSVKATVVVFDKLYSSPSFNRTMESFFKIENDLVKPIFNASSYFDMNEVGINRLDLLMLTTKKEDYKWNDSNYIKDSKEFSIDENIYGRVMKKSDKGVLSPLQKKTHLQLFYSQGVFPIETDKQGAFTIQKELLVALAGEKVFLRIPDKNKTIQLTNFNENIVENMNLEVQPTFFITKDLRSEDFKRKLNHTSFNSMNFLEEVVIKTIRKDSPKNIKKEAEFFGSGLDYVCTQYNILNCRNHRNGNIPVEGEKYTLNNGSVVVYSSLKPKTKEVKVKNFVTIECLYPTKDFQEVDYSTNPSDPNVDFRKTLYWKTDLESTENEEIKIIFYTSDIRGAFIGKIDVYSEKGLFGNYLFNFKVH